MTFARTGGAVIEAEGLRTGRQPDRCQRLGVVPLLVDEMQRAVFSKQHQPAEAVAERKDDPFVAGQMYAMFTVTTAFAAATTATDNVQILIKATTSAAPLVVGNKDIQALQLTIGATTRYRDVDLTKSHQIPIALNPQGINAILSLTTSGGYLTIYGLIVMENAAYAAVNFNAGAFDLDIRSYNAAGQKYYAQTRSVG